MTFDTKFKLGDLVYYMKYNKVCSGHIAGICIRYTGPNWCSESYYMKEDTGMNPPSYSRGDLFRTKEDLLKSL